MKRIKRKLFVSGETLRVLSGGELQGAAGGATKGERTSGPPPCGEPPSVGVPTCTGCTVGSAPGNCGSNPCGTGTFDGCTLVTF